MWPCILAPASGHHQAVAQGPSRFDQGMGSGTIATAAVLPPNGNVKLFCLAATLLVSTAMPDKEAKLCSNSCGGKGGADPPCDPDLPLRAIAWGAPASLSAPGSDGESSATMLSSSGFLSGDWAVIRTTGKRAKDRGTRYSGSDKIVTCPNTFVNIAGKLAQFPRGSPRIFPPQGIDWIERPFNSAGDRQWRGSIARRRSSFSWTRCMASRARILARSTIRTASASMARSPAAMRCVSPSASAAIRRSPPRTSLPTPAI